MTRKWIDALPATSGRSLDQWIAFINKAGPATLKERHEWLKKEHKVGTNSAWFLAARSLGEGGEEDSPEAYRRQAKVYVEEMFAGPKEGLVPLYAALAKECLALGKGVKLCPCKTIVPLYRNHVIAQIKPTSRTRIDFGLALGPLLKAGKKLPARLIDTGGFKKKDRITHRIEVTTLADVDDQVRSWLKKAYELDEKA